MCNSLHWHTKYAILNSRHRMEKMTNVDCHPLCNIFSERVHYTSFDPVLRKLENRRRCDEEEGKNKSATKTSATRVRKTTI